MSIRTETFTLGEVPFRPVQPLQIFRQSNYDLTAICNIPETGAIFQPASVIVDAVLMIRENINDEDPILIAGTLDDMDYMTLTRPSPYQVKVVVALPWEVTEDLPLRTLRRTPTPPRYDQPGHGVFDLLLISNTDKRHFVMRGEVDYLWGVTRLDA